MAYSVTEATGNKAGQDGKSMECRANGGHLIVDVRNTYGWRQMDMYHLDIEIGTPQCSVFVQLRKGAPLSASKWVIYGTQNPPPGYCVIQKSMGNHMIAFNVSADRGYDFGFCAQR